MRKALYEELCEISDFSNRIYQPYAAPAGCDTPYAVIKMLGDDSVPYSRRGSVYGFQVFIYKSVSSFTSLDGLVLEVREKLHGQDLVTDDGYVFTPEYVKTVEDFIDEEKGLVGKRIDFEFAGCRP